MQISKYLKSFMKLGELRKISKTNWNKEEMVRFLLFVDTINNLPEDMESFNGYDLDKWTVPSALKGLFLPERVSVDTTLGKKAANLKKFDVESPTYEMFWVEETADGKTEKKSKVITVDDYTKTEFEEFVAKLYGSFKVDPDEGTALTEIRKAANLSSVLEQYTDGASAVYSDTTKLWLMELTIKPVEEWYFDCDNERYVEALVNNIFKSIAQ